MSSVPVENKTLQHQHKLPHLPVPPLEVTAKRYLRALEGLQDPKEHAQTKLAVEEFLNGDGPRIQRKLENYAATKDRYVHAIRGLRATMSDMAIPFMLQQLHRRILVRELPQPQRSRRTIPEPILYPGVSVLSIDAYSGVLLTRADRDDPTPSRGSQLPRAASLIVSSLGFIHDLANGLLEPDTIRGTPLDMDQYSRVRFGA